MPDVGRQLQRRSSSVPGGGPVPRRDTVPADVVRSAARGVAVQRCAPENPGCDCRTDDRHDRHAVQRAPSRTALLSIQRAAGNRAAAVVARPVTAGQALAKSSSSSRQRGAGAAVLQRYYIEDCDVSLADKRRAAVQIAISLARKAAGALSAYALAANLNPRVNTGARPDPHTHDLLLKCFNDAGASTVFRARDGFQKIASYLAADDFTIECEDDCDGANAYVYGIWTDIHLCMNNLSSASARRIGEVLVHEVSHVVDRTDDNEYFYPPAGGRTTLGRSDAIDNADSFEAFAAQI